MLTVRDIGIIRDAVGLWGRDIELHLLRIFGNDITPAHWIQAGLELGKRAAYNSPYTLTNN